MSYQSIGNNIIELNTTLSTNNYAAKLVSQTKIPFGTVIMADFQSKGKGQRDSSWISQKSQNLLLSFIIDSSFLDSKSIFYLCKITALVIREFIYEILQTDTLIKWPNDILVGNKKIAGILIENQWKNNNISSSIVGMGINVNQIIFPSKINAISLKEISGKNYDLRLLLDLLNDIYNRWFTSLKKQKMKLIDDEYHQNLLNFNKWAIYSTKESQFKAKLKAVNQLGLLILKLENGKEKSYNLKEIIQVI